MAAFDSSHDAGRFVAIIFLRGEEVAKTHQGCDVTWNDKLLDTVPFAVHACILSAWLARLGSCITQRR